MIDKRIIQMLLGILIIGTPTFGCAVQTSPTSDKSNTTIPISSTKPATHTIAVYRGTAGCKGCSEAVVAWIGKILPNYTIFYVGPKEKEKVTAKVLEKTTLYVQPGGDTSVEQAEKLLGTSTKTAIVNYVKTGGKYLGICQGAYLAGENPGMGLLSPADTGQYITSKGATTKSEQDTLVPLMWDGRKISAYFQDGPYFYGNTKNVTVIARYTNGLNAAIVKNFGAGKVGVIGTHPEAPLSWYREAGLPTAERNNNQALGNALLVKVLSS